MSKKTLNYLCFIMVLVMSQNTHSQHVSEHLRTVWTNESLKDSVRFRAINMFYKNQTFAQPDSILKLTDFHYEYARQNKSKKEMANALNEAAYAYYIKGDFFGDVNDLNGEGNLIISGTVLGEYARISQFNGTDWEILQTIEGTAPGGQFGTSVAINNSGSVICVGASQNDAGGAQAGQVLVFENETLNVTDFSTNSIRLVPNPVTDTFTITTLLDVEEIIVYSILGQKLQGFTLNNNQITIDLSNQPSGTYLVSIRSKTNLQTTRVIKK